LTLVDELLQHHDEVDDVEMERQGNHQCFFVDPIYQAGALFSAAAPARQRRRNGWSTRSTRC